MTPVQIIVGIILTLGAVEATAYWWMHPAPTGLDQPVLTYQPGVVKTETLNAVRAIANSSNIGEATIGLDGVKTEKRKEEAAANEPAQSASSNPQSTIHNPQSTIHNPQSTILNPQSSIPPSTEGSSYGQIFRPFTSFLPIRL